MTARELIRDLMLVPDLDAELAFDDGDEVHEIDALDEADGLIVLRSATPPTLAEIEAAAAAWREKWNIPARAE